MKKLRIILTVSAFAIAIFGAYATTAKLFVPEITYAEDGTAILPEGYGIYPADHFTYGIGCIPCLEYPETEGVCTNYPHYSDIRCKCYLPDYSQKFAKNSQCELLWRVDV